jgi:hypothetical protein
MRTFARIRGKNGIPTLKRGGDDGWRIEHGESGFEIKAYEADPLFDLDEANRRITFHLRRDPFTPVAVLKAFMKMGLTLLPDAELVNFQPLLDWVQEADHSQPFAARIPLLHTFQPGPMRPDLIDVRVLRRRVGVTGVPYAFFVVAYGNEAFQVSLPSVTQDPAKLHLDLPLFPALGATPSEYGPLSARSFDLSGHERVKGEAFVITLGFDSSTVEHRDTAPAAPSQ